MNQLPEKVFLVFTLIIMSVCAAFAQTQRCYITPFEMCDSMRVYSMPRHISSFVIETRGCMMDAKEGHNPSNQSWSIVWDADSTLRSGNFIKITGINRAYGDFLDAPGIRVETGRLTDGEASISESKDLFEGINPPRKPNTAVIEIADNSVRILAGNTKLHPVSTVKRTSLATSDSLSYWGIKSNGRWRSELIVTEYVRDLAPSLISNWTYDRLRAYLSKSQDKRERLWRYFDRVNDPELGRLGGEYTLATVADGRGGYTILYVSGAKTNRSRWKSMMIKGHLTPTIYEDQYDLTWYDAMMRPVSTDCSAVMSPAMLEVKFPLYDTSFRFAPVLAR